MPTRKIIAYFMHEKEESICRSLIQNQQVTQSYVVGEVSDAEFEELKKQNIIMQVVGGDQSVMSDIIIKKGIKSRDIIDVVREVEIDFENSTASYPAFYKFLIDGPLLEEYRSVLRAVNIDIYEFLPPDAYLTRLKSPAEYAALNALDFVKKVEFYNSWDTGLDMITREIPVLPDENIEKKMLTFDILLHRAEDMADMKTWLTEKNVAIAGAAGKKIRIYLLEDSPMKTEICRHIAVQSFDEYIQPVFHNDIARQLLGLDAFTIAANPAVTYTGDGQVVGVADTGIDDNHPDFQNQIYGTPAAWARINDYSDFNGHGTHVAGSIAGNGASSNGKIKGTAPGSKIFFQSIMDGTGRLRLPLQLQTLFQQAYDNGARIHNNSWGSATKSRYTVNSIEVDDFVAQNRDMLLVFSAGNEGSAVDPQNVPPGYPDFLSIGSPASAKNILTVGASRSTRSDGGFSQFKYGDVWPAAFPDLPISDEKVSGDPNALAGFSSRGPCDDNRIKPDVVAPGTDILSVKSSTAPPSNYWGVLPGNNKYAIMGGTSMSSPIVAGCAAVVREYYEKKENHQPSAALVKATIINGCKKLTAAGSVIKFPELPNYNQGFGMVDMSRTIPAIPGNFFLRAYDNYKRPAEHFEFTGQRRRVQITLTTDSWLRICLAYTDIPGRALQNNLNLMLDYNPDNKKWIGNENVPSLLRMPDTTNNVEVIVIEAAKAGRYTMQITATNIIRGPQDFAFVISSGDLNTVIL